MPADPTLLNFVTGGNAKLDKNVTTFSLPAGYSCPGALECLAKADMDTGTITDGPEARFRCFAASSEAVFPSTRKSRWANFQLLVKTKGVKAKTELLLKSLREDSEIVRVHVSGDFFNQEYFDAWMQVARRRPATRFYAYTKSVHFWVRHNRAQSIPENFNLTASRGGTHDALIDKHQLKNVVVVMHPEEAEVLGLMVDHDDKLAQEGDANFALLIHGTQRAKSPAAAAIKRMKAEEVEFAYPARS